MNVRTIKEGITMDLEDWKRKLMLQEEESREYRHSLYRRVDLSSKKWILDVGCGTGAVTRDIASLTSGEVTALDLDPEKLKVAGEYLYDLKNVRIVQGDVLSLPFEDSSFDLVVLNIVLIYVKDQQKALDEMARVVKRGGIVLATLEPDYLADLDYPEDPAREVFLDHLKGLGADLRTGRRLKTLFTRAGLKVTVGIDMGSDYVNPCDTTRIKMIGDHRWMLERVLTEAGWSRERTDDYFDGMIREIERGERYHLTCAHYAIGEKL